jgi:hypothetical protein
MKRKFAATMVALAALGVAGLQAQTNGSDREILSCTAAHQHINLSQVERSYALCLKSPIDGVVESALAHITRLKLCRPEVGFGRIADILPELAREGRTPAIRYKAYIASMVYDMPGLFAPEQAVEFRTAEDLYAALSNRLQSSLLGSTLASSAGAR